MNDEDDLSSAVTRAVPADLPPYAEVLARRDRRRTRRRAVLASAGVVVLVAAVLGGTAALGGDDPTVLPSADRSSTPPTTPSGTSDPVADVPPEWNGTSAPPVVLQLDGREVWLRPWTSCFSGPPDDSGISQVQCSDGIPQPPFEDAGDRESVTFSFPIKGWRFEATFHASGGGDCARTFTVPVRKTGDYTFEIPSAGPAGAYDVNVFGRGPGGDVITTFAWTTSAAGEIPEPSGYLGLVSNQDDGYVAYGLEMSVMDLASTPRQASLTVTVTAANGAARSYGPLAPDRGCFGAGQVVFTQQQGSTEPFELGPAPFTYRAEVTLDGTTYVGTAVWPRDENNEPPYTDLTFDPPLPVFTLNR